MWSKMVLAGNPRYMRYSYEVYPLGGKGDNKKCIPKKNRFDIYPEGSMAVDFDWRFTLKTGDLIDVADANGVWYLSTVLDSRLKE